MKEDKNDIRVNNHIKGFAAHILEEIVKADMSMINAQIAAWTHFVKYRPSGNLVNKDIHIGFADNRYLSMNEVKLTFNIKPLQISIFKRFKIAFNIISGRTSMPLYFPVLYDFCATNDDNAIALEIIVKRSEDNSIKASYTAKDNKTSELLEQGKI